MNKKEIQNLFESFSQKKVLIIGDVMIDAYLWGKVERISPEAPVPVVSRTRKENRLGGAANVALNVQALGAEPILCGVTGKDDKAATFLKLLNKRGLTHKGILSHSHRMTTVKTRIISGNQHLLRVDEEIKTELGPAAENEFIALLLQLIDKEKPCAIIFEDYDKGAITANIIAKVVETANSENIPTLIDPKKRHFSDYKNVTLFKPNFKELKEGLHLEHVEKSDVEQIHKSAQQFREQMNMRYLFTTLSEKGVLMSYESGYDLVPAQLRDIADVSGAGDTVISTASLCLAAGLDPKNIATISNIAGGIVCEKVGVVPIDKRLLINELEKYFSEAE